MAMIAMDSANTSPMIKAVNIFGALEGFRPRAVILAWLPIPNTAQGPRIQRAKIKNKAKLRSIFFHYHRHPVLVDPDNPAAHRETLPIDGHCPADQTA